MRAINNEERVDKNALIQRGGKRERQNQQPAMHNKNLCPLFCALSSLTHSLLLTHVAARQRALLKCAFMCVCEFMYSQLTVNWSMRGEAPPLGTVKNEVVKCLQMSTSVCVCVCVCQVAC